MHDLKKIGFITLVRPWKQLGYDLLRPFDRLPLKGVGVEVGVFQGDHAETILRRHKDVAVIYCVDPYQPYEQPVDVIAAKKTAHKRLKKYSNRAIFIEEGSVEAASRFSREFVDFVYLDGNHEKPHVKADAESWWPKIKRGGVMGGHDFDHPGVLNAVAEFAVANGLEIHAEATCWWIFKP